MLRPLCLGVFAAMLSFGWWRGRLALPVIAIYGVMSVLTLLVYALDKAAARRQRQRTPEKTLHLLSLAGGWPGAMLAQLLLRHKTVKQPFLRWFWLTVALHVAGLGWYLAHRMAW